MYNMLLKFYGWARTRVGYGEEVQRDAGKSMQAMDFDGDGKVSVDEFIRWLVRPRRVNFLLYFLTPTGSTRQ